MVRLWGLSSLAKDLGEEAKPAREFSACLQRSTRAHRRFFTKSLLLDIARNIKDLAQLGLTIINPWERRGLACERCYEEMTTR
jgi:hypothetical protein